MFEAYPSIYIYIFKYMCVYIYIRVWQVSRGRASFPLWLVEARKMMLETNKGRLFPGCGQVAKWRAAD